VTNLAAETRRTIRERLLRSARQAEQRGQTDRARQAYGQLAALLQAQAEEAEGPERERLISSAQDYERLAAGRTAGRAAPRNTQRSDEVRPADGEWLVQRPRERLASVVGLQEVKDEIQRRFIIPFDRPDLREAYGATVGGGLLIYGPPGNGKTFLARAVAGELGVPFLVVEGANLISKWYGESEANLAQVFDAARGYDRCIVFIDELEWIAPSRMAGDSSEASRRLVGQLLQELNAFETEPDLGVLLIGATNCPWELDPAVIRPGRFDRHVYVGLPDLDARREMFRRELKRPPTARDVDFDALARRTDGWSAADIVGVVKSCVDQAMQQAAARGQIVPVTQLTLISELNSWSPSTPRDLLVRYEQWGKRRA